MQKPEKPYFQVERPYHFRAHPSLIGELCIAERMHAHLPQTRQQYATWLKQQELTPDQAPLGAIIERRGKPYQLTPRYLLRSVILPGRLGGTMFITDGNLWSISCDFQGIADFVQRRAAEFAEHHGMNFERALAMFRPTPLQKPSTERIYPEWAIGYDTASGDGIILDVNHKETPRRFLEGRAGIFSPYQGTD